MREQKQTPLLMKPELVLSTLEGVKRLTRRLNGLELINKCPGSWIFDGRVFTNHKLLDGKIQVVIPKCPFGIVGDLIWVREPWQHSNFPYGPLTDNCFIFYQADYLDDPLGVNLEHSTDGIRRKWKPSIHMRKASCRLWLEITAIRLERLWDITFEDAIAEGIYLKVIPKGHRGELDVGIRADKKTEVLFPYTPQQRFALLWDAINGVGSWDINPWVWVISFEKIEIGAAA